MSKNIIENIKKSLKKLNSHEAELAGNRVKNFVLVLGKEELLLIDVFVQRITKNNCNLLSIFEDRQVKEHIKNQII